MMTRLNEMKTKWLQQKTSHHMNWSDYAQRL
jgi:hypothetical protein